MTTTARTRFRLLTSAAPAFPPVVPWSGGPDETPPWVADDRRLSAQAAAQDDIAGQGRQLTLPWGDDARRLGADAAR